MCKHRFKFLGVVISLGVAYYHFICRFCDSEGFADKEEWDLEMLNGS